MRKIQENMKQHSVELSFYLAQKLLKVTVDRKQHEKIMQESLKEFHGKKKFYS